MGPDFILANISVDFADVISAKEVEADIAAIDRAIKQKFPEGKRIFIEAEKRSNRFPHTS
jgi:divalent metal cation (Fe/Co/Zn/Cd) transporter